MTIRLSDVPQSAVELLRSSLEGAAIDGSYRLPTLKGKRTEDVTISQPHPVYNLGVQDIAEGRGITAAVFGGWRFLLTEKGRAIGAAEVMGTEPIGTFRIAGVNVGPYVASTAAALQALPDQFKAESREWTLRMLRIPALFIWAVWFHEVSGTGDQFFPLGPAPEYLEEGRIYSWDELSEILRPPARSRLEDDFNRGNVIPRM
jgi:hypothetical protein